MSGGERQEIRFEGAGVSPGMACGKIHVVRDDLDDVSRYRIAPSQIPDEIGRFETALIQTRMQDRKSTRLNSSHSQISYAVFCLKKNNTHPNIPHLRVQHP